MPSLAAATRLALGSRWLVAAVFACIGSTSLAIEEPEYHVVGSSAVYEIREYSPTIVAETTVPGTANDAGNAGFRILAAYIFGQNEAKASIEMTAPVAESPVKIAMTAPVAQSPQEGGYLIRFTMPREWTLETLPKPLDLRVVLRALPARRVAVIRYSGFWSESRYDENLQRLKSALSEAGLHWQGEPVWARYDPPWIPWFLRRNEIWLELRAD